MKLKDFLKVICLLFAAKAVFGVLYLVLGWQVTIVGWVIPMWLIVVAVLADIYLSYTACKLAR